MQKFMLMLGTGENRQTLLVYAKDADAVLGGLAHNWAQFNRSDGDDPKPIWVNSAQVVSFEPQRSVA